MQLQDHTETILTPAAPPPAPASNHPNEAIAQRFYAEPGEAKPMPAPVPEVQALREHRSAADILHPAQHLFPKDLTRELALAVTPDASAEQLKAQHVEIAHLAKDTGMQGDDLSMLANLVKGSISKPVSDEDFAKQGREAQADLRRRYGDQGYARAAADAKALVLRDPRLAALVNRYRLGNNSALVLRMAELGREQRAAGRLK